MKDLKAQNMSHNNEQHIQSLSSGAELPADNLKQFSDDESQSDYDDFARCSGTPSNNCSSPKNSEFLFAQGSFQITCSHWPAIQRTVRLQYFEN